MTVAASVRAMANRRALIEGRVGGAVHPVQQGRFLPTDRTRFIEDYPDETFRTPRYQLMPRARKSRGTTVADALRETDGLYSLKVVFLQGAQLDDVGDLLAQADTDLAQLLISSLNYDGQNSGLANCEWEGSTYTFDEAPGRRAMLEMVLSMHLQDSFGRLT